MSKTSRPYNEIDDYIAAFSDEERQEYAAAEKALDLATMLYCISLEQEPRQQQAISRLEKVVSTMQLGALQRYLGALGYRIKIASSTTALAMWRERLRFLIRNSAARSASTFLALLTSLASIADVFLLIASGNRRLSVPGKRKMKPETGAPAAPMPYGALAAE